MALEACGDAQDPIISNGDVPIRFASASVETGRNITRTMGADYNDAGLPLGAALDVYIYNNSGNPVAYEDATNGATVTLPMTYVTTGTADPTTIRSALTLSDTKNTLPPVYPTGDDKNAYIFAVYPARPDNAATDYTFTVSDKQRNANNVWNSDLLTTDMITHPYEGQKPVDLPLSHRLSKVIVKFNPTGNLTAANMPETFLVHGVKPSVTVNPKSGTNPMAASVSEGTGTPITIEGSTSEAFIIPPQTISSNTTFLSFDIKGNDEEHFHTIKGVYFKFSSDFTFAPNTVYEITVNVNVNYISATATISPWLSETLTFDKFTL